ncbi:MAG: hypothetical protein PHV05_10785 [Candidatus Riflebacteria bacterium]|nr:hypothetical protein [Candidatus Riflebacteria bacterium]
MILGAYIVLYEIYSVNLVFTLKISKKLLLFLRDFEKERIKGVEWVFEKSSTKFNDIVLDG